MRALSVAARAAAAACVIVLGASCRPERLAAPGADGAGGAPPVDLGTAAPSATKVHISPDSTDVLQGDTKPLRVTMQDGSTVFAAVTWSTLDSSLVRVNSAGVVTGLRGGTARVVAKVGPGSYTARVVVKPAVQRVVTTPESGELTVGQQSQLGATVLDAIDQPMSGATVSWTSSNASLATVSASGLVSGVAVGDALIIATSSGKSDTTRVHVSAVAVASVGVAPASLALSVGAHAQLTSSAASATGAPLTGRLTTWTSSNEAVARVSASGDVGAVAPGTATITATIDGKSASVPVTVSQAAVASVSVAANATSLVVGQTTQVNATARDAAGATLSGRTVGWASSNAQVATVSSEGVVSAIGAGTATITGTSEGVQGTVTITVTQSAVASVRVAVNSASVVVGQTTQATATALDVSGQALTGRAVTWSIAPTSVASISTGGVVTAVAAGSATVTATVEGKSASVTVTVTAPVTTQPTPGTPLSVLPELPRATVATAESATPSTGATVRLAAGGDLQAAIDAARPGDQILLAPGASFTGNFVLRAKAGAGAGAWITIRTDGTLPAPGTRMTPATATSLARILTPNASPAIATEAAASYYRVTGVEVAPAATSSLAYSLISLGETGAAQSTLASVPHHLVFDRMYVHGGTTYNLRRCVALNSAWTAIVDSWLSECHSNDGDSQAIWGSNGPGPFTIVNNRLEGAGENVMFGGDDSRSVDLLPSDITIARNHIIKPASWQGVWVGKNLFELKVGKRVLLENNMLEGCWVDAQVGFALVVKSVNQSGGAPWSQTTDVTIRYNRLTRSAAGFSIAGHPEAFPVASTTARVLIEHNLVDPLGSSALGGTGRLFQLNSEPTDVVIRHNTGFGTNAAFIFAGGTTSGFVFRDNLVAGNEYNWSFSSGEGLGVAVTALDAHAPGWKVDGNLFISGGVQTRPPNNLFVATMGEVGFTDAGGPLWTSFTPGNYRLTSSSPYRGKASDGTDPGVDHDKLAAALAGVVK